MAGPCLRRMSFNTRPGLREGVRERRSIRPSRDTLKTLIMSWGASVLVALAAAVSAQAATGSPYAGAAACAGCHPDQQRKWSQSRHSKMVQPATVMGVKGDFMRGQIQLRGAGYQVRQREGAYYITESYLTGKPREHRVDYTRGNRRI